MSSNNIGMNLDRFRILTEGITRDGVDCHTVGPEYGGGNAIELESGLFLYSLVRRFNPITVIETGSHWGFASSCIAAALADMEESYPLGRTLTTIDVNAYDGRARRLWERIGVGHLVRQYIGDARGWEGDKDFPKKVVQSLCGRPIDFLWLDADHSAESVIAEWEQYAPCLNRQEAIVAFHDTRLDPRESEGIRQILTQNMHPLPEYRFHSYTPLRNFRGLDFLFLTNEVPA